MIHTYLGNKVSREWMPLSMANGIDDSHANRKMDNLYRWKLDPLNSALYKCGKILGKLGMNI